MTPEVVTEIVLGVLGWTALIAVVQLMALPVAVEAFRQRIFELRRELFMYMADGHIAADDAAYVRLRGLLNRMLRYAEHVTLLRLVVMNIAYDPTLVREAPVETVITAVRDERVRAHLRVFHYRVSATIMWHIVATSPVAWALAVVVLPLIAIRRSVSSLVQMRRLLKWVPARVVPIRRFEDQAELLACA